MATRVHDRSRRRCCKFCICKDYVVVPDDKGELPIPKACNASDNQNACCNLTGRQNNPDYPLCKS